MFPDGYSVLSGSDDKTCRLFDMRSDCQLNVYSDINRVNSPVTKVEFSPSGRLFFASYGKTSPCPPGMCSKAHGWVNSQKAMGLPV